MKQRKKTDPQDGVIEIGGIDNSSGNSGNVVEDNADNGNSSFEDIPSDEYYDDGIIRIY